MFRGLCFVLRSRVIVTSMRKIALFIISFGLLPLSLTAAPKPTVKKWRWSPLMLSVYPDTFMLPRARTIYGLEVSLAKAGAERVRGFQTAAVWAEAKDVNGFQIGTFRSQSKTLDGFQIAIFPLTLSKLRGAQIGLINNLKFEDEKEPLRVHGFQIGGINSANNLSGFQFGILNTTHRARGAQIGFLNSSVNSRALQIGAANLIGMDSDPERIAKGVHIGAVNVTTQEFHGVQIGLYNSVQRLRGVQIGVINYVHRPRQPRLLLVPLINVGW